MVTERAISAVLTEPMAIHVNPYEPASGFESRWGYQYELDFIELFPYIRCDTRRLRG